jgi:hypothetical protein
MLLLCKIDILDGFGPRFLDDVSSDRVSIGSIIHPAARVLSEPVVTSAKLTANSIAYSSQNNPPLRPHLSFVLLQTTHKTTFPMIRSADRDLTYIAS